MGMSMWEDSPPVSAPFYLEWSALLSQTSPWRASPSPRVAVGVGCLPPDTSVVCLTVAYSGAE